MPQNLFIDEKSIIENVLFKNSINEKRLENLMKEINLFSDIGNKNIATELEFGGKTYQVVKNKNKFFKSNNQTGGFNYS